MEDITHRAVIQYHDFAEVRFHLAQVLDVCAVTERAMLTVLSSAKVLALTLKPIDDGIRILLDRCGEDNQIVPLADLVDDE